MKNNGIEIVNPGDRDWTKHRFILAFGAYGDTKCMVWANSLDDALDEAVDYLADKAPGLFCDDMVSEEFNRLVQEGLTPDEAAEKSMVDVTIAGNNARCLPSWEWGIVAEDPTREQVLSLMAEEVLR